MIDKIALALTVIGAINWGCVGLLKSDIVALIFGSPTAIPSRIIYTVIFLAGLWCISLFFRDTAVREKGR